MFGLVVQNHHRDCWEQGLYCGESYRYMYSQQNSLTGRQPELSVVTSVSPSIAFKISASWIIIRRFPQTGQTKLSGCGFDVFFYYYVMLKHIDQVIPKLCTAGLRRKNSDLEIFANSCLCPESVEWRHNVLENPWYLTIKMPFSNCA